MLTLEKLREEFENLAVLCWEVAGLDLRDNLAEKVEKSMTRVESELKTVEDEQRWIPVEEKLPYDFKEVLVSGIVFNKHKVSAGWLEARKGNQRVWCLTWGESPAAEGTVTHWRPLPQGPRKKEVQE